MNSLEILNCLFKKSDVLLKMWLLHYIHFLLLKRKGVMVVKSFCTTFALSNNSQFFLYTVFP